MKQDSRGLSATHPSRPRPFAADGNPCDMAYAIDSAFSARVFIVLMPVLIGVVMVGALALAFGGGMGGGVKSYNSSTRAPAQRANAGGARSGMQKQESNPTSYDKNPLNQRPTSTQLTPVGAKASAPLPPPKGAEQLPPGWRRAVDKKSGRTYYVEVKTNRTQWQKPTM